MEKRCWIGWLTKQSWARNELAQMMATTVRKLDAGQSSSRVSSRGEMAYCGHQKASSVMLDNLSELD